VQPPLPTPPAPISQPEQSGSLAWLESLAAEQGDDLFNLDLSGLPIASESSVPSRPVDNPMNWLEDLARTGDPGVTRKLARFDDDDEDIGSEKIDPFAAQSDPVEWLDTLARRGGADVEELTTRGGLNIPLTSPDAVEAPAYEGFTFDAPASRPRFSDRSDDTIVSNPVDFLNSLAGGEGYGEDRIGALGDADDDDTLSTIQSAISSGTVTTDQMQTFLEMQAGHILDNPSDLIEVEEFDIDLIPEIPDWLREMQPVEEAAVVTSRQPLESIFDALPEAVPMPDWLTEVDGNDSIDISAIFADELPETFASSADSIERSPYPIEVNPEDPWVEAFDLEHEEGVQSLDTVPAWYARNTSDPERIAAVDQRFGMEMEFDGAPLDEVNLPAESSLPLGQEQALPMWIGTVDFAIADSSPVSPPPLIADVPDWLSGIDVEQAVLEGVPDWLIAVSAETEPIEPIEEFVAPEPPPMAAPVRPPVVAARPPAPPPTPPQQPTRPQGEYGDVAAMLQGARDLEQGGDLESSLAEYEALIRANVGVDAVVDDLSQLLRSYRTVPAVYRVLGDGLMRQGKLQQALNTYREALNQL